MAEPVEVYSSGVLVSSGVLSEEQELEQGGCNSMFVRSGGTAVATVINEGTVLTADSGAVIGYINVEEGGLLSATDAYCSGAARWYGPVACATAGDIILSGGTYTQNVATELNDALGFGGAVQVYAGTLSVTGGQYLGNSATGGGGAAYVNGNATIDGAEFSANSATYGGAVEMAHPGSMTITNAVFSGNSAEYGGGFENHQGASATIIDTIFDGNAATSGGAVLNDNYALEKCYLTVNNVVFTGNTAEQGGAIENDGVLVVSEGVFADNTAEDGKGGALYNIGTATVTNATFAANTAVHGGAVWQGKKTLTLNDDVFTGNIAIYGGALYANTSGSTVISGGAFTGNAAPYDDDYELGGMGGAVYVAGAATVTITDTFFSGNSAGVNPANEWDGGCGGAVINYGELTVSGGTFTENSAYYGGALYNQAPYPAAGENDGTLTVIATDFSNNVAEWGGGAICNCYGVLTISGGTFTDNTVTGANSRDGGAIANWSEAEITEAIFEGNTAAKGGAISNTGTTLTVTDSILSGNSADEGGAFWSLNEWGDSVAIFVNCSFTENTAEDGGALWNGEALTVSGGEFADNTAEDGKGGALYNAGAATVEMAAFAGNTALYGGAVWQGSGALEIKDTFFGSNTGIYGGALYANTSGSTVISGGAFTGNAAPYDDDYELGGMGGAIYIAGGATMTVTDAIFEGNYAGVNPANEWDGGCGGAVINYGELTVSGGEFAGNSAYYGGALYNQAPYPAAGENDGTLTVIATDFSNNVAEWGGGAICNCYGMLTVSSGTFTDNTVTGANSRDGGAIANWSEAEITEAIFEGNTAAKGGAISNTGTTLTVTDSILSGNSADEGGAFWSLNEWGDSVAIFVNCSFTGNTATQGGAIWNGEELYLSGCDFTTASDSIYNAGTITVTGATAFGAEVVNADGAAFTVSLAEATTETAAAVEGWSFISGGDIRIAAFSEMAEGDYSIATGVGEWSGDIALFVDATSTGSAFTLAGGAVTAGSVSYGGRTYTLADDADALTLTISAAAPAVKPTLGDINGNGISDILFQNLVDPMNPLGAWMDADMWQWNGALGPAPMDEWTVYGAFDFTGDGYCDIMFRSKLAETEYAVGFYDMGEGGTFKTMGWGVTAEWDLAQVGDFNGNGVADILWRNSSTGYHGLWLDGTNQWVALPYSYLSPDQTIFGAGDVNGDGCDEILIDSAGTLGAWDVSGVIAGTAEAPAWSEFGICLTSDWLVVGSADFDGNGIADIAVWNQDSGLVGAYMNCDANQWAGIFPSASPAEWAIPGFGDYDGDGCDDVLVRNLATGALGCWSGGDGFAWKGIGYGVDATWAVIA